MAKIDFLDQRIRDGYGKFRTFWPSIENALVYTEKSTE